MAVGQQEEKKSQDEEAMFITPVSYMPIFGTCIDDSLSYQKMKKCSDETFVDFFYSSLNFSTVHFAEIPKEKRAIVQFMILKDGSISDIKFRKVKIPKSYEDEIIRVLQLMPCWRPGTMMGKPLDILFTLPVRLPETLENCISLVERMPIFKGCENERTYEEQRKCSDKKLLMFFYNNFRFPKEIRQASFYMTIPIRWKFEKDGSISTIQFLRPSHESLEKEFLRIVRLMPEWKPAMHNREPTEVCFTFPFRIHLR